MMLMLMLMPLRRDEIICCVKNSSRLERDLYSRKDKEGVDIREWLKADIRSWSLSVTDQFGLVT